MVVVTHEMAFAKQVGTRLIFMEHGKISVDGDPREVAADAAEPALHRDAVEPEHVRARPLADLGGQERERLEPAPEAPLRGPRPARERRHLAALAREERDDLVRLAVVHGAQDDRGEAEADGHGRDRSGGRRR